MENILTKALKEVLTPRYSEELRDSSDTGHALTEGFETKMRELIRRVDRPKIHSYTRYIAAAAACAVIGIGAAVIIPGIMNNRVEVAPEQTSATAKTPVSTQGTLEISDTDVPESSETINDVTTSETTDNEPTSETGTSADIPSAEVSTVSSSDTTSPAVVDDDGNDINPSSGGDVDEPDSDDDVVVSNDTDEDWDEDGDDDADDDIATDEDDGINITVEEGKTLDEVFADNFGGIKCENMYPCEMMYVYGITDDHNTSTSQRLDLKSIEYSFANEFIRALGSAEAVVYDEKALEDSSYIYFNFTDVKEKLGSLTDGYWDNCAWKRYDQFFGRSSEYVDDDDVDADSDDQDDPILADDDIDAAPQIVKLRVEACHLNPNNGLFRIGDIIYYNEATKEYKAYFIDKMFKIDTSVIEKLIEGFATLTIPEGTTNVKDLADSLGISEGNIAQSSAKIDGVYDISVKNAKADNAYIAELFTKYGNKKLTATDAGIQFAINDSVQMNVILKNGLYFKLYVCPDGYIYVGDNQYHTKYKFKASSDEFIAAIESVTKANGIKVPLYYKTLGEYLEGKSFNKLTKVGYSGIEDNMYRVYELTDKDELEKIYKIIEAELPTAKYLVTTYEVGNSIRTAGIIIWVKGYLHPIFVYDGDIIEVYSGEQNYFRMSSGTTEKIKNILLGSEKTKMTESVWEDVEDDDYDDTPITNDSDDQNPIT